MTTIHIYYTDHSISPYYLFIFDAYHFVATY
jgi:hypothetical protein